MARLRIFLGAVETGPYTKYLYPTGYADPDLFGAPVVTCGHVDLAPTGYVDPDAFGAPTVTAHAHLAPTGYVNSPSWPVTTESQNAYGAGWEIGAYVYNPAGLGFGSSTVTWHNDLAPTGYNDPDYFGTPVVDRKSTRLNSSHRV